MLYSLLTTRIIFCYVYLYIFWDEKKEYKSICIKLGLIYYLIEFEIKNYLFLTTIDSFYPGNIFYSRNANSAYWIFDRIFYKELSYETILWVDKYGLSPHIYIYNLLVLSISAWNFLKNKSPNIRTSLHIWRPNIIVI